MNKGLKYAFIFVTGVTVGIGVCGVKVIGYALSDYHIRKAIGYKFIDKVDEFIYRKTIINQ